MTTMMMPLGADAGAGTRAHDPTYLLTCVDTVVGNVAGEEGVIKSCWRWTMAKERLEECE